MGTHTGPLLPDLGCSRRSRKNPNIYVKCLDLFTPAMHFKFFKLVHGPGLVLGPPVYNFCPVRQVQTHPALPTFSWPLKKDHPEHCPTCLSPPPAQRGLSADDRSQSKLRSKEGAGAPDKGGKVGEQLSNPICGGWRGLMDFNYISF